MIYKKYNHNSCYTHSNVLRYYNNNFGCLSFIVSKGIQPFPAFAHKMIHFNLWPTYWIFRIFLGWSSYKVPWYRRFLKSCTHSRQFCKLSNGSHVTDLSIHNTLYSTFPFTFLEPNIRLTSNSSSSSSLQGCFYRGCLGIIIICNPVSHF